MAWQQLKFFTDNNSAEWLSDLLMGLGALSVTLEDTKDTPIYEPDPTNLELWQDTTVIALLEEDEDVDNFIEQMKFIYGPKPFPSYQTNRLEDQNWQQLAKDQFKPMQFGDNLWICPSWYEIVDESAVNILLDPGLAFGTGTHPTTSLCLQWLSQHPPSGLTVVDYGCGSGILAIAALKLGAAKVYAVDIHEQALLATKENANKNTIDFKQLTIVAPEQLPAVQVDVLIANILLSPLLELCPHFASLLKSHGQLVVSGILEEQFATLCERYQEYFEFVEKQQQQEWLRIWFRKIN